MSELLTTVALVILAYVFFLHASTKEIHTPPCKEWVVVWADNHTDIKGVECVKETKED